MITGRNPDGQRPAVFLDRDGTLMEEVDYCRDPAKVRVFPGVPEALQKLKDAGYLRIIVTNQAGIGRGIFTEAEYAKVHEELLRQLGEGSIDGAYYCPDAPWDPSTRRKPKPGMVLEAAKDFRIDLTRSWFVGDKESDVECGHNAGVRSILVDTGYGAEATETAADLRVTDVPAAIGAILRAAD